MLIVLAILGWIALGLAALLLVLLLVPITARAEGAAASGGPATGRVELRWGGGLVRVTAETGGGAVLRLFGLRIARLSGGTPGPARPRAARRKRRGSLRQRLATARANRGVLARVLRRLLRALHLRGRVEGTVGLDDPADTAVVHGLLRAAAGGPERFRVAVECDWVEEGFDLQGTARAVLWPVEMLVVAVALWARRDVRRVLRAMA